MSDEENVERPVLRIPHSVPLDHLRMRLSYPTYLYETPGARGKVLVELDVATVEKLMNLPSSRQWIDPCSKTKE